MARKPTCALQNNTNETDTTSDDTQSMPSGCPLAEFLIQIQGEPHYKFLDLLLQKGMLQRVHGPGIYAFVQVNHPCPFTQPLQDKQP